MTDIGDLIAWLRGVLDGDEREAQAATSGVWEWDGGTGMLINEHMHFAAIDASCRQDVDHIVRHQPRAVLADIAAKRAVLDAIAHWVDGPRAHPGVMRLVLPERVIRHLATAYAHRPGYRAEWRPTS